MSNDWWQGTVRGKDGLIPDKYISVKIKCVSNSLDKFVTYIFVLKCTQTELSLIFGRDEDRDKSCDHLKSSSSEESVRKRRPSGNISINSQLSIFSQTTMSTELDAQHQSSRKIHT